MTLRVRSDASGSSGNVGFVPESDQTCDPLGRSKSAINVQLQTGFSGRRLPRLRCFAPRFSQAPKAALRNTYAAIPFVAGRRQPGVKLLPATLPPMLAPSAEGSHTYDLCINVAGRRLYWRNPNHGVTLSNDTIAWTIDGDAMERTYGDIGAIHLNSAGQKITADRCTITFADGSGLLIVNTDPGGYRDAERATRYRDFVRDLHARLASNRYPEIRFTAGRAALALSADAGFGDRRRDSLRACRARWIFVLSPVERSLPPRRRRILLLDA